MKRPELPPNSKIETEKDINDLSLVLKNTEIQILINEIEEEYLYWDKFKYKVKNLEILPEVLWRFVKFGRSRTITHLKISDINGFVFKYNQTSAINRQLHEFDMNMGGVLEGSSIIPHDDKKRYLISSIMEEAIASSQLEGAVTTREEAKEMLRTNRKPKNHSEKMILNNYLTMQRILKLKDQELSIDLILEIHSLISKDALDKEQYEGRLRDNNNVNVVDAITGEVFYCPPNYEDLSKLVKAVCEFANTGNDKKFIHPIIKGIVLHFLIGYIHPFFDGNGRTARAIFYWFLISKGYWLIEYLSISRIILKSRTQYAKSYLHTEFDENDLTYFIDYNLKSMEQALNSLKVYIAKKISEKSQLFEVIKHENINERQIEILRDILNNAEKIITINDIQEEFGVAYQTARTDLLSLEKLGYLELKQRGKKMLFFRSENFETHIKKKKY